MLPTLPFDRLRGRLNERAVVDEYIKWKKGCDCSLFLLDCRLPTLPRASLQKNRKLASLRFLFCFLQFLLNASILGFAENKNSEAFASLFFAERGGFEPPVPVTQYVSLANWWFQPLTHLSVLKSEHLLKAEMRVQRYMFFG